MNLINVMFPFFPQYSSAYKFFTSEMMRSEDLRPLDNNDRIKEVGRRWREMKLQEKKKYEAKKEAELKTYRKNLAKYKRVRIAIFYPHSNTKMLYWLSSYLAYPHMDLQLSD